MEDKKMDIQTLFDTILAVLKSADWASILVSAILGYLAATISFLLRALKAIRNSALSNSIGLYHGYYINPTGNRKKELKKIKVEIYRSIFQLGLIKIKLLYPQNNTPHKGVAYSYNGVNYFKIKDKRGKFEETLMFQDVLRENANLLIGTYSAVTQAGNFPCCGIQVLSKEPLDDKTIYDLMDNQPSIVAQPNNTFNNLLNQNTQFQTR